MALIDRAIKRTLQNEYRRQTYKRTVAGRKSARTAASTGTSGVVSIAGQVFPASGVTAASGAAIAVRNAGRLADARYVPDTGASIARSVVAIAGGGGGGGGSTYTAGSGIDITSDVLSVKLLAGMTALTVSGSGLAISNTIAGDGLDINSTTKVLSVDSTVMRTTRSIIAGLGLTGGGNLSSDVTLDTGAGFGITVAADSVAVNQAMVPTWTGAHRFNSDPQLAANLDFIAGDRSITGSGDITLAPTDDLLLSPGGTVYLADATQVRTTTYQDNPLGIIGARIYNRGGNVRQLTIGAIKADELFVRVFTADEMRVNRGEEMWARSYGTIEEDFTVPALLATVDVWFEEAPNLGSAKLFLPDNWLILRTFDIDTGITAQLIWFKVVDAGVNDYIQRQDEGGGGDPGKLPRQQWRLRRMTGGLTGSVIKRGWWMVDIGQPATGSPGDPGYIPGQGIIWLSALAQDGGPYIAIQNFSEVVSNVPQFDVRVIMGNLTGRVDYATDIYGFAVGNDLSIPPSAGFSGLTADEVLGLRLFNTDVFLYDGAVISAAFDRTYGISLLNDATLFANDARAITWYDDLDDIGSAYSTAKIGTWGSTDDRRLHLSSYGTDLSSIFLTATGDAGGEAVSLSVKAGGWDGKSGGVVDMAARYARLIGGGSTLIVGGDVSKYGASPLHAYQSDSETGNAAGITAEQAGGGDAVVHWVLAGGQEFVAGIDNNDGDKFKISAGSSLGITDFITIDPTAGTVTIVGLSVGAPATGLSGDDGITLAGSSINVDTTVVRTSRNLVAGDGLNGGGTLGADRTFNVDSTVIRTTRVIASGAGLTGGGTLGADRTLAVGAGDGITVNADDVAVNATVARTVTEIIAGLGLVGGGTLAASRTLSVGAGDGIAVSASSVAVDSSVARTSTTVTAGAGLTGGGTLAAGFSLNVGAGDGMTIGADSISVDGTVVRTSRSIVSGAGLTGGGTLGADRTLAVGAGDGVTVGADTVGVDGTVVRTSRTLAAGNGLTGGGDLSANRTFTVGAGDGITVNADDVAVNSTVVRTSRSLAAGAGLTGGGDLSANRTFDVGQGDGITVAASYVSVNLGFDFGWTGTHTFNLDPQVNANLDFIGGARSITGDGNLTLLPTGDLVLSPTGDNVLPAGSYEVSLGSYNRKYKSLYVGELYTESIVAQDVMATIGGRVLITPSTSLVADVADTDAVIDTKHNNLGSGMYIRLENAPGGIPQFEVMKVTSSATTIGADHYRYSVDRAEGGSANFWLAGDGIASLRTSADEGWIDLSSSETVLDDFGPTITVYSRSSATTWDDVAPVVSMGNLESFVDYPAAIYGFAAGNDLTLDGSTGYSGLTIDTDVGLRLFNTRIEVYESGVLDMSLGDNGITIGLGDSQFDTRNFLNFTDGTRRSAISSWMFSGDHFTLWSQYNASGTKSDLTISNINSYGTQKVRLRADDVEDALTLQGGIVRLLGTGVVTDSEPVTVAPTPKGRLQLVDNNALTDDTIGLVVTQQGAGDSKVTYVADGQSFSVGIDNSDGNKFKISNGASLGVGDALVIGTDLSVVMASSLELGGGLIAGGDVLVDGKITHTDHPSGGSRYAREFVIEGYYVDADNLNVVAFDVSYYKGVIVHITYGQSYGPTSANELLLGLGVWRGAIDGAAWRHNSSTIVDGQNISIVATLSANRVMLTLHRTGGNNFRSTAANRLVFVKIIGDVPSVTTSPSAI